METFTGSEVGRWWFEHRRISVDQIGNMSDHLSFDLAAERIDLG